METTVVTPRAQRTCETSARIAARNVPSAPLQPYFSVRPNQTRYTHFSLGTAALPPDTTPIKREPPYSVSAVFNPGDTQGPWSGFATNINTESVLRNQVFAAQRAAQAVYVPSSSSGLYVAPQHSSTGPSHAFRHIEAVQLFPDHNPNPDSTSIGKNSFHNHTRQQLKDVGAAQ